MLRALLAPLRGLEKPFFYCTSTYGCKFEILKPFWDLWEQLPWGETLPRGMGVTQGSPERGDNSRERQELLRGEDEASAPGPNRRPRAEKC